ncbi:MAG TPA: DUF1800 family protein [Ideonella sp.]|nr:DUF1800 family protein [Ideonella sp.]
MAQIQSTGTAAWVRSQMALSNSRYSLGGGDAVHKSTVGGNFCETPASGLSVDECWRLWFSAQPLAWDFYRNAFQQPDQLRQRVAYALQQIVVVSELEVSGTYGFRNYYNMLLDSAFGNYRQLLKQVALSPLMGAYLNNANNDKAAPNENFAREFLQLFSIGTCALNADGSLRGGNCIATYDNQTVRNYAFALTGWTYPSGGATPWGCPPGGSHCTYYGGDMVPVASRHDQTQRALLSGVGVPAGSSAPQALELVLDSVMAHPNMPPFVARQLIRHLVSSNPSAGYVQRVAQAFIDGRYAEAGASFGAGQRGDLAATVAAVLLDSEARTESPARSAGKLREPTLLMTGVLRALNGRSDGEALIWLGRGLQQHLFRPPSVFNDYPSNYPLPGTSLSGPTFAIHNTNSALARLNFLTFVVNWGGSEPTSGVPGAFGTHADLKTFEADAADPAKLVDRLSLLALGKPLPATIRAEFIAAVGANIAQTDAQGWPAARVRQAALLVFASPDYQVQR